jgi:hypothetical protein
MSDEENIGAALIARRWEKPTARAAQAEKMRAYWAGMNLKQRRRRLSNLLETVKVRKGKRGKNGKRGKPEPTE